MFGLNRNRHFLRLPKSERNITLDTPEDMEEFSKEVLKSKDCECALFYVHQDESYTAFFKTTVSQEFEEGETFDDSGMLITYSICKATRRNDTHFFAWLDGEFRFCCYSLLFEKEDGSWEVCS